MTRPSMATIPTFSLNILLLLLSCPQLLSAFSLLMKTDTTSTRNLRRCNNNNEIKIDDDPLLTTIPSHEYEEEDLPTVFAYPHCYEPHPIAIHACNLLRKEIESLSKANWTQHDFGLVPIDEDEKKNQNVHKNMKNNSYSVGKMFGVLIVKTRHRKQNSSSSSSSLGFLKAYSGTISGVSHAEDYGFCPIIYNRLDNITNPGDGSIFSYQQQEAELNTLNRQVTQLENHPERRQRQLYLKQIQEQTAHTLTKAKSKQKEEKKLRKQKRLDMKPKLSPEEYRLFEDDLIQQSAAHQRRFKQIKSECNDAVTKAATSLEEEFEIPLERLKQLRKDKSAWVQNQLFDQYQFLNIHGRTKSLLPIFADTPLQRPPSGAGDCVAPKLLQYAFQHNYVPVAMAEFWWGQSPMNEIRRHNNYYPACRGKCEPILNHMMDGMTIEDNPLDNVGLKFSSVDDLEILYDDPYMAVVNKPSEMLSVPGRHLSHSVYSIMMERYPDATGPLLVHRLDMSTSGILVIAKDKDSHQTLQAQFIDRTVKKRYTAILDGIVKQQPNEKGQINLPLSMDYINRPMQRVDYEDGKSAKTYYEIVGQNPENGTTRIHFYPVTGRTHQLRVHAAHNEGLGIPIVGDDIYGQRSKQRRLCLHAGYLEIQHPITKEKMKFLADAPF